MAFKMRNSVIHGTRIHGEMLALNYECCGDKPEDGRAASSAFQHTHTDAPFMSNKFMGERNKAIKAGESSFTVDGKSYEVTGDKTPFEKGGCGNPTLGADNVNVQSPNAPYRYRNGYAFKENHANKEKSYMDKVYAQINKMMGDTGTNFTAKDLAGMSEQERIGNIDGYEKGDFSRMMRKAKNIVKGPDTQK
tara:strand:- start:40 stop:615 length:576 start_codon:yes stop_codon:yes gene_type:complete